MYFSGSLLVADAAADRAGEDGQIQGDIAAGEPRETATAPGFAASGVLRNQVEFWKLIFTKYGKDQAVFHHRQYPQIVYSVLDFSDAAASSGGAKLERIKNEAIEEETARIHSALLWLADGSSPRNPFERRIERLFSALPGGRSSLYTEAADSEQIRSQTGIRERFREGLIRSGRYLKTMEKIFRGEGLPAELTRLPLIESSFDYTAYSSVGAAGIWQFMRSTGKKHMRIDSYIDERKDPVLSTRAAARYLDHAYEVLGAWPLAVTSYNHGITGVARAVKSVGSTDMNKIIAEYKSDTFGFASKNFYAEFLAAVEVERDKARYFPGIQVEQPWNFIEVRLERQVGIYDLARISGASVDDILRLNTALLSPVAKGRAKIPAKFLVKLPQKRYGPELAQLGEQIRSEQEAVMELGGRKIYGVVEERAGKPQTKVKSAVRGAVPAQVKPQSEKPAQKKPGAKAAEKHASAQPLARKIYVVRAGDTLSGIAKQTGVKVSKLRQLNPAASKKLKPGIKLKLE